MLTYEKTGLLVNRTRVEKKLHVDILSTYSIKTLRQRQCKIESLIEQNHKKYAQSRNQNEQKKLEAEMKELQTMRSDVEEALLTYLYR